MRMSSGRFTLALASIACVLVFRSGTPGAPAVSPDLLMSSLAAEERGVFCDLPGMDQAVTSAAAAEGQGLPSGDTPPVRYVTDPYPTFNGVAVDAARDRVFFSDTNRKALLSYSRSTVQKPNEVATPLKRIMGPTSGVGFVAGVTFDSERQEVYTVNNDVEDRLVVFPYDAEGDVKPKRLLYVPHQSWGVSLNKARDEIALSVQSPNMIVVYRRDATGLTPPLRSIRGHQTRMADPHGIHFDDKHNEIVVANHGNWRGEQLITAYTAWDPAEGRKVPAEGERVDEVASGRYWLPSVTVYPGTASGNVAPAREITGPLTELNWPMGVYVDAAHDEIVVASNGNDAVLVFRRTDTGNVAPARVLRGSRTTISGPMGVTIDPVNDELWVANFGDHTASVFPRTASGNVAPKRILRNAPPTTPTSGFGNPYSVAYDSKREQILVPN